MEEYSDKVMMMMVRESTDTRVSDSHLEYSSALPSTTHLLQSSDPSSSSSSSSHQPQIFHHRPLLITPINTHTNTTTQPPNQLQDLQARIIAHPLYSKLLQAYINCQKIGAPPEVVDLLAAAGRQEIEARRRSSVRCREIHDKDPELDQFMEAYSDMLVKYEEELTRPMQEAMDFMRHIQIQLNMLCNSEDKAEGGDSSEEEHDDDRENSTTGGETEEVPAEILDPRFSVEDRELKNHLLRKYSGCLSSLKQQLSKKKKKAKLPKDARHKLLNWWELHYKWPYPSDSEKVALAELTGLDQKQINNWFINQRKRHWKPSEDMQIMLMHDDELQNHPQNPTPTHYMDPHYMMSHAHQYRLGPSS